MKVHYTISDQQRRGERGFTLLEVMIAGAILAIALGALVKAASVNAANAAYLRDRTFSHWVAMNKLNEWYASGEWPDTGRQEGRVVLAEREWHWRIVTTQTPDEDIRRLEIEVRAETDEGEPISVLTGFIGRP